MCAVSKNELFRSNYSHNEPKWRLLRDSASTLVRAPLARRAFANYAPPASAADSPSAHVKDGVVRTC